MMGLLRRILKGSREGSVAGGGRVSLPGVNSALRETRSQDSIHFHTCKSARVTVGLIRGSLRSGKRKYAERPPYRKAE
ncbi:hypothetical protein MATL_G00102230 [Megalops atlanticus]|uniref:Uncharacterized protein n=1 Tax=Megalops atlanticus TaxID=7932 RepID=A0A9D3T612_MEGAT|nr:hypothetical protein MATL_G00102230 [Megalops atlanticus]